MKKIIFLILSLVVAGAGAEEQQSYAPLVLGLDIGRQVFPISVTGSFFPPGLIPYPNYPPLNVEPGPATAIDVSHLPAGTLIRVKRLGAAQFLPSWLDETIYTMAVFANANGDHIPAGEKTNAWTFGPVHYCPTIPGTGVVDFPYDMNISGNGVVNDLSFILEIPVGAAKLLVATADCPSQDNTDPNGDYKLEVSYPIIEKIDIYQVVKNPILLAPSTTIDLVAGKNADIVVKTSPGVNVEGSYIEWKDVNGTELTKKIFNLKPGQTTSTASGDVTFYIDPVPKEAGFINGETQPRVFLRGKNISGIIVDLDTSEIGDIKTKIHKTKPIRLGFVPISGCIDDILGQPPCFAAPSSNDVTNMAKHGGDIMKAMYPVAEDEFFADYFEKEFKVPRYYKASNNEDYINDIVTLDKRKRNNYTPNYVDFLIGIFSDSYLIYRNQLTDSFEMYGSVADVAKPEQAFLQNFKFRSLITRANYFYTLPHEMGHIYSLMHTCQDVFPGPTPCSEEQNTLDGYNSSVLSADWSLGRKLVGDRYSLMRFGSTSPGFVNSNITPTKPWIKNKWISREEYLQLLRVQKIDLFKKIRKKNILSVDQKILNIFGEIKNNIFIPTSAYFSKNTNTFNLPPDNGDYRVDVLNSNKNLIFSNFASVLQTPDTDAKYLGFDLPVSKSAMFIKIFKINPSNTLIGEFSIPAQILQEEVKFLDPKSVSVDFGQFKNSLTTEIKKLDDKLKCQNYPAAQAQISNNILSLISQKMSTLNLQKSLNMDKSKYQSIALDSLTRTAFPLLNANSFYNPFIDACLEIIDDGFLKRSKIEIEFVRYPENKEYGYVAIAQIDNNIEIELVPKGSKFLAETTVLAQGMHFWKISTFMVNKKTYQGVLNAIKQSKKTLLTLNDQLTGESDPDLRAVIQKNISAQQRQLDGLIIKKKNEETKISQPQIFNFEVL